MQRNKVEVRLPGVRNSTKRIATETESAKFWSDFSYTLSPADHWNFRRPVTAIQVGGEPDGKLRKRTSPV